MLTLIQMRSFDQYVAYITPTIKTKVTSFEEGEDLRMSTHIEDAKKDHTPAPRSLVTIWTQQYATKDH